MASGGNLIIIDEDGNDLPWKVARTNKVFRNDEAAIFLYCLKDKIQSICTKDSVTITREPKNGKLVKELVFEYDKSVSEVDKELSEIAEVFKDFSSEDIRDVPEDKSSDIDEMVDDYNKREDIVVIPKMENNMVTVIGRNYEAMKKTVHELKVKLGMIQTSSSRRNRGSAQICEESTASKSFLRKSFSKSDGLGSGDDGVSLEVKIYDKLELKIYKASITRVNVDVIVNAANENLNHGGGVAFVISEAAGYELDRESREYIDKNGPLQPGENTVTEAGRMGYEKVIHAVGPVWSDYRDKAECLDVLYKCVYNILKTCNDRGYRTVAMTAISSGIFGVPKELCADMYILAATDFAERKSKNRLRYPEELHIIDIDVKILELTKSAYERWKKDPSSLTPKNSLDLFKKNNPGYRSYETTGASRPSRSRGRRSEGHGQSAIVRDGGDADDDDISQGQWEMVSNMSTCKSTVKKMGKEKFRWGGEASVYTIDDKIKVKVFVGDIDKTSNAIDAIVCGINKTLQASGYIWDSLKKAGGPEFQSKHDKMVISNNNSARLGDVLKCRGGRLKVDHVIFVVSERIVHGNTAEFESYQNCIENVLERATEWKLRTLVIPMFGTGNLQSNKHKLKQCAEAIVFGIDNFVSNNKRKISIEEIHLTNKNGMVNEVLTEAFDEAASVEKESRKAGNHRDIEHSTGRGVTSSKFKDQNPVNHRNEKRDSQKIDGDQNWHRSPKKKGFRSDPRNQTDREPYSSEDSRAGKSESSLGKKESQSDDLKQFGRSYSNTSQSRGGISNQSKLFNNSRKGDSDGDSSQDTDKSNDPESAEKKASKAMGNLQIFVE